MLNLEPAEIRNAWRAAIAAADLLRREGDATKAARVESLARILSRELERRDPESIDSQAIDRS
ncbi:MAG TPA: hypothetical protein VM557_08870 [Thermoanaerobaculia bacterium]|nr:hypothetical protein [Thermoanaerobaculia bacterium]